jgi:membrane-associated protein
VTALEAAALLPMLLPSWMDPDELIKSFGAYALWGVAFIIFAECGLFAILPGDSLLFTVGLLTATGVIPHNLAFVCIVLTIAAVLGNVSGYAIGRKIGPPLFRPRSGLAGKVFKQSYVDKTHVFLERYGNRALILARFVPIVRTFVTLVAGVGKMNFRHFITYTAIGGVLWACGVTIAGYFLGNIPIIKNNIDSVLVLIVAAVVVHAAWVAVPAYIRHYSFKDDVAQIGRASVRDDRQVLERLMHAVREHGLETRIREESFHIETGSKWRRIECSYEVPLQILPGFEHHMRFRLGVEEPFLVEPNPVFF